MIELADALCKLFNDTNAKIQLSALENLNQLLDSMLPFIDAHIQLFYKSLLTNLGSTNLGVRKSSEALIRQLNDSTKDKVMLLHVASSVLQGSSNMRLRPPLLDQVLELLELSHQLVTGAQEAGAGRHEQLKNGLHGLLQNTLLPQSFKLLDDAKSEVKQRNERLLRMLYSVLGHKVLDACPKSKLQRVSDICLGAQPGARVAVPLGSASGQVSTVGSKKEFGTGTFGASGSQLHLNSRT